MGISVCITGVEEDSMPQLGQVGLILFGLQNILQPDPYCNRASGRCYFKPQSLVFYVLSLNESQPWTLHCLFDLFAVGSDHY